MCENILLVFGIDIWCCMHE